MARLARLLAGGIVVAALAALGLNAQAQTAVGTALTYQAELRASGQPAVGPVDLRFRLYNAATVGATVGPQIDRLNVVLAQGRFTQDLDFGVAAFGPDSRYLEIEVRNPAGAGAYVTLSPRQRVSAAPVAQFALDAASAATAVNATSAANATQLNGQGPAFYQNAANLSSGTIPSARLGGVYSGVLSLSNPGNTLTGGGAGLTGVNADLLDGLNSTAFLQSIPMPLHLSGTSTFHILRADNASTFGNAASVLGWSTATTGFTNAVVGRNASTSGRGVFGDAQAATGITYGVFGQSNSTEGRGVYGFATAPTGFTHAGSFQSVSTDGTGVSAWASAATGSTTGVSGQSSSTSGRGVHGLASAADGATVGGYFQSNSTAGLGVYALANAASGSTVGVFGQSVSTDDGRGVYGLASSPTGLNYGIYGASNSSGGRGVFGYAAAATGINSGVYGQSASTDGKGVVGHAFSASGPTYGGDFRSTSAVGTGVLGWASASAGAQTFGVSGQSNSPSGRGVYGNAVATTGVNYGVLGQCNSTSGYAVFATGNMAASGVKTFRIDHPDDPANKYLLHYAAESPEVINFYRGTVVLDGSGGAVVDLPAYFAKVNKDPSYVLTAVGAPMPMLHVALKISEAALSAGAVAAPGEAAPVCSFRIAGGAPGGEVSWRVEAVRNDRWVQRRGAPVEVEKQGVERGTYQHPELYDQSATKGMNYDARREDMQDERAAAIERTALEGGDR